MSPCPAADKAYGILVPGAAAAVAAKLPTESAPVHPLVARLLRAKHLVVWAWLLLSGACLPFSHLLLSQVSMVLEPVRGTDTARAVGAMEQEFPQLSNTVGMAAVISCTTACKTVLGDFSRHAFEELAAVHEHLNTTHAGIIKSWDQNFDITFDMVPRLSADKQSVLFSSIWVLPTRGGMVLVDAVSQVRSVVSKLSKEGRQFGFTLGLTGTPNMFQAYLETTMREITIKDAAVLPLALGMFVYQVGSWRLAVLSVICMGISATVGFATMVPVTYFGPKLAAVAPPFMAVTCIAMSVDYSMFLMSRLREELQQGLPLDAAISVALVECGSVVGLSGSILIMCFASCMLFPGYLIFTLSLGVMWILVLCLATSLTMSPCLIAMFPGFFTRGLGSLSTRRSQTRGSRTWFRLGAFITQWPLPILVPLVLYACLAPAAVQLAKYEPSEDMRMELPRGPPLEDLAHLQRAFPESVRDPIYMHLKAGGGGTVRSDAFFAQSCKVLQSIARSTSGTGHTVLPEEINSVVAVHGPAPCPKLVCLHWSRRPPECPLLPSAQELLNAPPRGLLAPLGAAYRQAWAQLVSSSNTSSLAVLTPSFDQTHGYPDAFVTAMREAVPDRAVFSTGIVLFDMKRADYKVLPWVLALVVCIMFAIISIAFRVAFAPIKLFLTVIVPLISVYGMLVSVFQLGVLDWLHSEHVSASLGVSWVLPVISVPVLVGLQVDYDVLLFARVMELRMRGFDNRAAVVGGISLTGPIITGAGIVMAAAFGGLILSDIRETSELGFVLCAGVLLDTFVIRCFLVPSVLMLGGGLNFWPRKLPEATRTIAEAEEWLCTVDSPATPLRRTGGAAGALLQRGVP